MDDEIDPVGEDLRGFREDRVDRGRLGDVAMPDDVGVELLGEGLDPLAQGIALIGEGEFGAVGAGAAGDAPGDRAVVGDPEDDAPLARQKALPVFRHDRSRSRATPFGAGGPP